MTRADLKDLIRTIPDFPAKGIRFRDITTLLADGPGLAAAVTQLGELAHSPAAHGVASPRIDAVAGIEARGFIFGTALALHLGVGFIPLRKAGKLPVPVIYEDYALEYGEARLELDPSIVQPGQTVLLIDDLLATGGTALAAANLLRRAGGHCPAALFVIDLPELGGAAVLRENGVEPRALLEFSGH